MITSMLIIMNNSFIMAMMMKRNTLSCLTAFLRLFLLRRALQPRSSPCPMRPSRPDHHHDEEADDDGKDGIDDKNGQIDNDELLSPITRRQGTRERAITERIQSSQPYVLMPEKIYWILKRTLWVKNMMAIKSQCTVFFAVLNVFA